MKKKLLVLAATVLVFAAVAFATGGFDRNKEPVLDPPAPNGMVPSLMVDGVLYRISPVPDEYLETAPDPADYLGAVTASIPLSQMPTKDGESNTHEVGTPFAACEKGIAVLQAGAWRIFVPTEGTAN